MDGMKDVPPAHVSRVTLTLEHGRTVRTATIDIPSRVFEVLSAQEITRRLVGPTFETLKGECTC